MLSFILFKPCHVVYTDFRPTPLQHYLYPSGGDGLYLVQDEKVLYFTAIILLFIPLVAMDVHCCYVRSSLNTFVFRHTFYTMVMLMVIDD